MPKANNPLLLTALLSAASVLAYIGYRALSMDSAQAPAAMRATGSAAARELPDQIPDVVLEDLNGQPSSLTEWSGSPLLINFWATWCAPCLREIPLLKEFQEANPSLSVIGIAVDRARPVAEFAREMNFNYPVLVGQASGMNAATALGVDVFALPFSVFVDSSGATLGVHIGELHPEHLANFTSVLADRANPEFSLAAARSRMSGHR